MQYSHNEEKRGGTRQGSGAKPKYLEQIKRFKNINLIYKLLNKMNRNYNLSLEATVTATISVNDETVTISTTLTFDPYNDCTDEDGLNNLAKDAILEEYLSDHATPIEVEDITPEIEITHFSEIPAAHTKTLEDIFEFAAALAECDQDIEVVQAALYCGIGASDKRLITYFRPCTTLGNYFSK